MVGPEDKVLILSNGAYGERQKQMCRILNINFESLDYPDDQAVSAADLKKRLSLPDGASFTHVSMVHHETTAGVLNPLTEVCEILEDHFPEKELFVDSMSAFGAYEVDLAGKHRACKYIVSSANKNLEGVPGRSGCSGISRGIEGSIVSPRSLDASSIPPSLFSQQGKAITAEISLTSTKDRFPRGHCSSHEKTPKAPKGSMHDPADLHSPCKSGPPPQQIAVHANPSKGFSFVVFDKQAFKKLEGRQPRSLVLDLHAQAKGLSPQLGGNGQFRFTPPTHTILAFHQALIEWEAEGGWQGRGGRYQANYEVLGRNAGVRLLEEEASCCAVPCTVNYTPVLYSMIIFGTREGSVHHVLGRSLEKRPSYVSSRGRTSTNTFL